MKTPLTKVFSLILISGMKAKGLSLRVGSTAHRDGQVIKIKNIVQHKKYNPSTVDYDFSLLELEDTLEFANTMMPIELPESNDNIADKTMCLVTGWGDTQSAFASNKKLRGVEVPVVNQEACKKAYSRQGGITERMLCKLKRSNNFFSSYTKVFYFINY